MTLFYTYIQHTSYNSLTIKMYFILYTHFKKNLKKQNIDKSSITKMKSFVI